MSFGLEVFDAAGNLTFSASEKYVRVVDVFNPYSLSVPGSKTYSGTVDLRVIVQQGNSRIITVTVIGNTVSWDYSDGYSWPEYSGSASIRVLTA